MFENHTEEQARKEILSLVEEYCNKFHKKAEYKEGDRIPYASRVYDSKEMTNLVHQEDIQKNLKKSLLSF